MRSHAAIHGLVARRLPHYNRRPGSGRHRGLGLDDGPGRLPYRHRLYRRRCRRGEPDQRQADAVAGTDALATRRASAAMLREMRNLGRSGLSRRRCPRLKPPCGIGEANCCDSRGTKRDFVSLRERRSHKLLAHAPAGSARGLRQRRDALGQNEDWHQSGRRSPTHCRRARSTRHRWTVHRCQQRPLSVGRHTQLPGASPGVTSDGSKNPFRPTVSKGYACSAIVRLAGYGSLPAGSRRKRSMFCRSTCRTLSAFPRFLQVDALCAAHGVLRSAHCVVRSAHRVPSLRLHAALATAKFWHQE